MCPPALRLRGKREHTQVLLYGLKIKLREVVEMND